MDFSININDEEIYPISSSCINVMDFHEVQFFLKVEQDGKTHCKHISL